MRLRYFGHSTVALEFDDQCLLIDPWFEGNPFTPQPPGDLKPTLILLTHGHGDHMGDAVQLATAHDAPILAVPELAHFCQKQGARVIACNHGGWTPFPFGRIKTTFAYHSSSSTPERVYTGLPCGFVVDAGGYKVYHAGDTCLFGDMQWIGRAGLDVALVPIGDRYTMGPEDALEAVRLLSPRCVIPIHYNTWDVIQQDAEAFSRRVREELGIPCVLAGPPGEVLLASVLG